MEPDQLTPDEQATAAALRRHAPRADPRFVAALRGDLFPAERRTRPALVAAAIGIAAATAAILVLGLVGAGPLAPSGQSSVNASDRACQKARAQLRTPELVRDAQGHWQIHYRPVPVKR